MCQFQKRLDTYDRPIGLTDAIRIMGCSAPRASQVPGESQLSVCTCSVDSGRTAGTRPIKCRSMAPGVGKTEAPAIGLSKLNSMAFRLAVYASPDGLPAYDARLASGRWSSSTGRAFHPQDSYERFQICILHFILLSQACLAQSHRPTRRTVANGGPEVLWFSPAQPWPARAGCDTSKPGNSPHVGGR